MGNINCVTAPPLLPGPTIPVGPPHANPLTPHGAPHGRPRGPVRMASCNASAPPAPRAGHPSSAMWPQCRVAPTRWSRAPRVSSPELPLATSAPVGKDSLFEIFLIENALKIHLKIK